MPHRIVFSDIDGTLLNKDRELSAFTISEIKRIKDRVPVILVSSRMPAAMTHLQEQLEITDQPLICYNGGLILAGNKTIHSTFIKTGIIESLRQFRKTNKFHISLYHHHEWYVPEMDSWAYREQQNTKVNPTVKPIGQVIRNWKINEIGAHKIMCMGEEEVINRVYQFLEDHFSNELHLYRSKSTYIEVAHKSISKLTAIEILLEQHFNMSLAEVVAFGDNYNDISMIQAAGTGVAVANAKPETIEIADQVTLAGKDDGVATFIKNNIVLQCEEKSTL